MADGLQSATPAQQQQTKPTLPRSIPPTPISVTSPIKTMTSSNHNLVLQLSTTNVTQIPTFPASPASPPSPGLLPLKQLQRSYQSQSHRRVPHRQVYQFQVPHPQLRKIQSEKNVSQEQAVVVEKQAMQKRPSLWMTRQRRDRVVAIAHSKWRFRVTKIFVGIVGKQFDVFPYIRLSS